MEKITVIIENILCERETFVIAVGLCDNIPFEYDETQDGYVKVIGNGKFNKNIKYELYGTWKRHNLYGWQFAFERYEEKMPDKYDLKGIEAYLSSGLYKGIGPVMAKAIVKHFGSETLDIIENDTQRLAEVKGISKKKVESVFLSYKKAKRYENLMILLSPHGISTRRIIKLIEYYGEEAEEIIKNNPYKVAKEIEGFGFLSADSLALALGIDTRNIERVKEGIKHCLKVAANTDGHVYLPKRMLCQRLSKLLNAIVVSYANRDFQQKYGKIVNKNNPKENLEYQILLQQYAVNDIDVDLALSELSSNEEIKIEYMSTTRKNGGYLYKEENNLFIKKEFLNEDITIQLEDDSLHTIIIDNKELKAYKTKEGLYALEKNFGVVQKDCFLTKLWYAEKLVAKDLKRLISCSAFKMLNGNITQEIENMEKVNKVKYAKNQQQAMLSVLKKNVLVMTGGPGTGKTTTIKGILGLYSRFFPKDRILLAAPTGRAAKRMSEATGRNAQTIHRLLEYGYEGFTRNRENPLECDLLILDEISMLDIELFSNVLKAIPDGCKLVLVGDANQLPSVGPGRVLKDLIDSKKITCICLQEIFRQKDTSLIVVNANKINNQETSLEYGNDFQITYEDNEKSEQDIVQDILETYKNEIKKFGVNNVQVLVPFRKKTLISVDELNKVLSPIANPHKYGMNVYEYNNIQFKENDRVMQMVNNYDKGVYNGDIGTIISIEKTNDTTKLSIDYDGILVDYFDDEVEELVLAYATTIHKSQGSEYASVIMPILKSQSFFLNRSIFYTGITRAKKKVSLIANAAAIQIAIHKNDEEKRKTKLATRL